MKKIIIAALAATLSLSLFGLDVMDYVPLKDGVKSYTCTEYSIASKFGEYFKTKTGKVLHKIDAAGNDTESYLYSARDNLENSVKTTFDSMGKIISQSAFASDDSLLWKTDFVYKDGLRIEANDYDLAGNLRNKTIYKYENGLMVDETGYDAKGALVWKTINKYDDAKRLLKVCEYQADGSLDNEIIYTYKEDGRLDTMVTIDPIEGAKQNVFRYSDGLLSEITTYNVLETGNKVCERLIIKYDDKKCVSKVSDYLVSEKFGGTVNELIYIGEFAYTF